MSHALFIHLAEFFISLHFYTFQMKILGQITAENSSSSQTLISFPFVASVVLFCIKLCLDWLQVSCPRRLAYQIPGNTFLNFICSYPPKKKFFLIDLETLLNLSLVGKQSTVDSHLFFSNYVYNITVTIKL